MNRELTDYDIFPKVFPCNQNITITIKPMGDHVKFDKNFYTLSIQALSEGAICDYPDRENETNISVCADEDGCIRFTHNFENEDRYFINIIRDSRKKARLSVYAVFPDLVGKYPYKGNFHTYSFRSYGTLSPAVLASLYRKNGFDFFAVTDRHRYFPSLESIYAYKDIPLDFKIFPGEEIHMPNFPDAKNDITIVNFGGRYSINALIDSSIHNKEVGNECKYRSFGDFCPDTMSAQKYYEEVCEMQKDLFIPNGIEKFTYASCVWIFEKIRKSGGLGIFCHPYQLSDVYHVPETLTKYLTTTVPFDAFEVIGDEGSFGQNGFQSALYYDDRVSGIKYPVLGSCNLNSENILGARSAFSVVLSPDCSIESIIKNVKDFYCTAVESEKDKCNIVGETRFVRYTYFLLSEYFPLHDELCFEEGRLMRECANKDENAKEMLILIKDRVQKLREKYFKF